jgi:hypothetical protein
MTIKSRRFTFGKYKGKEVLEIICTHTGYILWLLQNTQFKLYDLEQEVYDAVAKGKMEGVADYIYDKRELGKFIKNKDILTPFASIDEYYCGIKKELANTKLGKIIGHYLDKSEYSISKETALAEMRERIKGNTDAMHKINSYMFDGIDDSDTNFTMSSFLY